jgi:phosphoglycerate dehydrogenase-like enzyme
MEHILVLMKTDESQRDMLRMAAPGAKMDFVKPKELKPQQVEEADIVIGNLPERFLPELKRAKLLQLQTSGVAEYYLRLPQYAPDTILCSASGAYGVPIAEYMLSSLLAMMKRLHIYRDDMKKARWQPRFEGSYLYGARVLSLGMGDIGGEFASRCALMGAEVIGIRRRAARPPEGVLRVALVEELDELLPWADAVALSLPETGETVGIMNRARFERMKQGSYILNVGRGSAIDQEALLWALQSGKLAGAGLDVCDPEPLPEDHPLWQQENLLLTPHISGQYFLKETQDRIVRLICANIKALREGGKLTARVDFGTGYRD